MALMAVLVVVYVSCGDVSIVAIIRQKPFRVRETETEKLLAL